MFIRKALVPRLLVPALVFLGASALSAHAAPQNRIRTAVADSDRASVRETVPGRAKLAADLGEAGSDRMLSSVTLHFSLTDPQQADLTQLLQDQQNPSSPHYHQWLTPQQYGARFGLTSADLAKVQTWLTSKSLKVLEVAPSQNYITVSGSVGQIETAFNTRIHSLMENGERHISNITDPELPSTIARVVAGISGLNDFRPRSHAIVRPHFTSTSTGNHYIAPGDFYALYDVNPLIQQGIKGDGINIAVVGQTDISLSDVAAFRTASGLSANAPNVVHTSQYVPGVVSGDVDEAQLDVEWSGAVAQNATINFVTVGSAQTATVMDALTFAIANSSNTAVFTKGSPSIITISYGNCEEMLAASQVNSINLFLQQANVQGITIFGAAGDAGATDCEAAPPADFGLTVDFPGSSPFVTSAGGTMFNEGPVTGATPYWNINGSSTNNGGSATGYIPEAVWNESTSSQLSSGGGGASSIFSKPYWQVGISIPQDAARDVPDLSLNAAASHDGYLFCSQGSCTNTTFRDSQGNLNVVGGTSVVAPSLAGIFALLEQQLGSKPLGNINPNIYGLANSQYYGNVFHDTTTGNNNSPCQAGTMNCATGGSIGHNASIGYDLATGWGSIDVAEMASKWSSVDPIGTATGAPTGTVPTNTLVSTSSALCGVSGSLTLTIKVSNVSGAQQNTPTGNVQILLDGKAISGAVVALDGTGSASYAYTPGASLSSGNHTLSAVYSGDSVYSGSQGTITSDFVSTGQPDFSMTPCSTAAATNSGTAAAGIAFTLTPVNNFSGTVSFNVSANETIAASFAISPVTITAGSPATANLVITASKPSLRTGTLSSHNSRPASPRTRWYAAGSGATLACVFLLMVPRRRRWTPLVALLVSVAAISFSGCGGGGSTINKTGGNSGTGGTNATPGTYTLNVTATSGNLVHTSVVTFTVH
jgi:subtilase family serine protease